MSTNTILDSIPPGLAADAARAATLIKRAASVVVASHIDADGISAAAIAESALKRQGIPVHTEFFKKLDGDAIGLIRSKSADMAWFTDFGSGSLSKIEGMRAVVSDHHVPESGHCSKARKGQSLLSDFSTIVHVNPQVHEISGASELSGAGTTLLVALAMDVQNKDLVHMAILGAVGDLQDQRARRLEGLNRVLLAEAERIGLVEPKEDIRYFGRETRPIHKMLEYSSDPFVPRITGNEDGAIAFLLELGIDLKDGDEWRTWMDLTSEERAKVIAAIQDQLASYKRRPEVIDRLVGEVYSFPKEKRGTPVRDAKEFATLLNACGRHGQALVGLRICEGDRGDFLDQGMTLLRDHRSAISKALTWAKGSGIIRLKNIQFFDAGDEIEDTIVGTVAGMLLGSEGSDRTAPMVAFAESTEFSEEPKIKASARGTQELVSRGLDLSKAIRTAAEKVGGIGGGHNIAAGATIPSERRDEFLTALDEIVGSQVLRTSQRRG